MDWPWMKERRDGKLRVRKRVKERGSEKLGREIEIRGREGEF